MFLIYAAMAAKYFDYFSDTQLIS